LPRALRERVRLRRDPTILAKLACDLSRQRVVAVMVA
jgi:hypothetical protein